MLGFPSGSDGKESARNAGDPGSIPGSGRFPGGDMATHSSTLAWEIPWMEGPSRLQSSQSAQSCLTVFDPVGCSMLWTTVHGVAESQT